MLVWECEKCGALSSYTKGDKSPKKCSLCGGEKGKKTDFKNDKLGRGFKVKM